MHHVHHKNVDGRSNNVRDYERDIVRRASLAGASMKKDKASQLIVVRNKFTKEPVDLEVGNLSIL